MIGGGEHSFLDLLSHLPSRWEILAAMPHVNDLGIKLRAKGISSVALPLPSLKPWYAKEMIKALMAFKKTIRRHRPNLIYANGPRALFYGGMVGRIVGLPVIWHCRIADPDPCLDWLLTRISNRIITNSMATARRFGPDLKDKVEVVYNGIDLDWLNDETPGKPPLIRPEWKVVLMVARISKGKRHDLALRAFEKTAEMTQDCHLVCVGAKDHNEPGWWDELQGATSKSPFLDRIHLIGKVDDVRPWYRAASVLLFPSENEAFGRVLVEAMGSGIPVVATRSGGVPEIIRDGEDGFLTSPNNPEELAYALLRVLMDEQIRNQLSENARKRALQFGLKVHVERMVQVFERAARRVA